MRNLELLNIEAETAAAISTSRDKLLAFLGIKVDILEVVGTTLRVRVEQAELKNNWLLNQRELTKRAATVFSPISGKYKLHYVALTYAPNFENIEAAWIKNKMAEFGLSRNDVIKQMEIDKSTLSEMLSGNKPLTKFHKAAFYYYILTYEINRDIRLNLLQE